MPNFVTVASTTTSNTHDNTETSFVVAPVSCTSIEGVRRRAGYSYPSTQPRAGPAPLASFEDLPSDEMNSDLSDSSPDRESPLPFYSEAQYTDIIKQTSSLSTGSSSFIPSDHLLDQLIQLPPQLGRDWKQAQIQLMSINDVPNVIKTTDVASRNNGVDSVRRASRPTQLRYARKPSLSGSIVSITPVNSPTPTRDLLSPALTLTPGNDPNSRQCSTQSLLSRPDTPTRGSNGVEKRSISGRLLISNDDIRPASAQSLLAPPTIVHPRSHSLDIGDGCSASVTVDTFGSENCRRRKSSWAELLFRRRSRSTGERSKDFQRNQPTSPQQQQQHQSNKKRSSSSAKRRSLFSFFRSSTRRQKSSNATKVTAAISADQVPKLSVTDHTLKQSRPEPTSTDPGISDIPPWTEFDSEASFNARHLQLLKELAAMHGPLPLLRQTITLTTSPPPPPPSRSTQEEEEEEEKDGEEAIEQIRIIEPVDEESMRELSQNLTQQTVSQSIVHSNEIDQKVKATIVEASEKLSQKLLSQLSNEKSLQNTLLDSPQELLFESATKVSEDIEENSLQTNLDACAETPQDLRSKAKRDILREEKFLDDVVDPESLEDNTEDQCSSLTGFEMDPVPNRDEQSPNGKLDAENDATTIQQTTLLRRRLQHRADTLDDEIQSLPEQLPSTRRWRDQNTVCAPNSETSDHPRSSCDEPDESENQTLVTDLTKNSDRKLTYLKHGAQDSHEMSQLLQDEDEDDESSIAVNSVIAQNEYQSALLEEAVATSSFPLATESATSSRRSSRLNGCRELNLQPLERPRSSTPVQVAPLDTLIKANSNFKEGYEPPSMGSKLTVHLPGEQFERTGLNGSSRLRSPRQSNAETWLQFCGKSLQSSPRHYSLDWQDSGVRLDSPKLDNAAWSGQFSHQQNDENIEQQFSDNFADQQRFLQRADTEESVDANNSVDSNNNSVDCCFSLRKDLQSQTSMGSNRTSNRQERESSFSSDISSASERLIESSSSEDPLHICSSSKHQPNKASEISSSRTSSLCEQFSGEGHELHS